MTRFFQYEAKTGTVTVKAQPHYSPDHSEPSARYWVWHYHIRIENRGHEDVQLIDRHWIIHDGLGEVREVRGEGVVGEQPVIAPGQAYDYVSACPLPTPYGTLGGKFGMQTPAGTRFKVEIPTFDLVAPGAGKTAN